ncbi:MAG: ribose-phosphate pyrophosphokinase [Candidatus Doudnabacteria bacterium]|nr:ribose-phosphate pyrophosphokinase [Candidatus Doudnabacteria bacterium]
MLNISYMLKLVSPNFSDLFAPNIEIGNFPDGNTHIRIPKLEAYAGKEVTLFHRLYPNQNTAFFELLLILEALKEIESKVTLVSPYLPYARHDKAILEGEITSASVTCNLIARAGCQKLITFDCHFFNEKGEKQYGDLFVQNFSMGEELIAAARELFGQEKFEVVGLDKGAAYLVKNYGNKFLKKSRKAYGEDKIGYRDIEEMAIDFDLAGRNVLLIDDMISTGSTMLAGLEKIKQSGAKKIGVAAVHGLFLAGSAEKIGKMVDFVLSTDTVPSPLAKVSIKEKINKL